MVDANDDNFARPAATSFSSGRSGMTWSSIKGF
jgi:hypothetical protein